MNNVSKCASNSIPSDEFEWLDSCIFSEQGNPHDQSSCKTIKSESEAITRLTLDIPLHSECYVS